MSGDLYAPQRPRRGVWVALAGASAILHVLTLALVVLAFQSRAPLPQYAPEAAGQAVDAALGRHGRALLEVGAAARPRMPPVAARLQAGRRRCFDLGGCSGLAAAALG